MKNGSESLQPDDGESTVSVTSQKLNNFSPELAKREYGDINVPYVNLDEEKNVKPSEEKPNNQVKTKKLKIKKQSEPLSQINRIIEDKNLIMKLSTENNELKKKVNSLTEEDLNNSITINKLKSEKFIILSELNELIIALKQVDIKKLDKYFELNSKMNKGIYKKPITSSMGISYNIMSAQMQLGLISQSDLLSCQLYAELDKIKKQISDFEFDEKVLIEDNLQENKVLEPFLQGLTSNCINILKEYEEDFNISINKV